MFEEILNSLVPGAFLPHGNCLQWNSILLALHVGSDSLIAISYYSIPFALAYFIARRSDLVYRRIFILFAAFILACGTTHLFDVWTLWHPDYLSQGLVKAGTALLSFTTAAALWVVIPRALTLPSHSQLAVLAQRLGNEIADHRDAVVQLDTEVAERRAAEKALRTSEQRLEMALAGADLGLWDWDILTGALVINDRWVTMIGYSPEEIHPNYQQWVDLVHSDDLAKANAALSAHFKGETSQYQAEYRLRTKSGEWLWVLARGRVFEWDDAGNPLRAVGTHMDIHERKHLESRLQQQQDALCYAHRLSTAGELAATIAHEINQPLGAIANYAGGATFRFKDLLREHPALDEVMKTILKLASRAGDVVSGIRDLVRKHDFERQWVDVEAMLQQVLPLIHGELQRKNVRFSVNIETGLPCVWGQSIYLQQLVLNLLLNAIDALASSGMPQGELALWVLRKGDNLEIGVSDNGPGFAPEVAERLFQPFVSTKTDGIGLGLSISRTIVEAHGGTIWASADASSGVTWHVLLPTTDSAERQHRGAD